MSEQFDDRSPQELEDLKSAIALIDPGSHAMRSFAYFFPRHDEVRGMPEDEVPDDNSDAWVVRDSRYIEAVRDHHKKFFDAAEAVAKAIAAERNVYEVNNEIKHEVSRMLIAGNRISSRKTITTADFLPPDGELPPVE